MISQTITMYSASFIPSYMKQPCQKGLLPCSEHADRIFEPSLNIFGFSHMSQACDPRPACASQLLSVHSLASLQLGSIQYACCWQSSLICFSVCVTCCIRTLVMGYTFSFVFCYIFPSPVPGWEHMVCLAGVLASIGNWKKCLRSQNADRDSIHRGSCWSDSKRQGGREEAVQR